MVSYAIIFLGGGLGAMARHAVGVAALRFAGSGFPMGTLVVNVFGSFLMGLFVGVLAARMGGSPELRLFVATGFLGGFTTFSAFSLDAVSLWERGAFVEAVAYCAASVGLALVALVAGLSVARSFGAG
ncbi:MAG: fluoride efflux transporter CrcB [Pseudomonadota bacterium]